MLRLGSISISRGFPLVVLGLIIVLVALNYYVPNLLGSFSTIARWVLGALACGAGIWIIYSGIESRTKIDDLLSLLFGGVLISLGAYLGFGVDVANLLTGIGGAIRAVVGPIIAATLVLVGIYFLQRRGGWDDFIGIILVIAGLGVLGISLTQYITQSLIQLMISGTLAFAGIWLIAGGGRARTILGLILILMSLGLLGMNFMGIRLFG